MEKLHLINYKFQRKRSYLSENRKSKDYRSGVKHSKRDTIPVQQANRNLKMILHRLICSKIPTMNLTYPHIQKSHLISNTTFESLASDSANETTTFNLSTSFIEDTSLSQPTTPSSCPSLSDKIYPCKKTW